MVGGKGKPGPAGAIDYDAVLAGWSDPDADYDKLGEQQAQLEWVRQKDQRQAPVRRAVALELVELVELAQQMDQPQALEQREPAQAPQGRQALDQ